jgi:hypothetical protein
MRRMMNAALSAALLLVSGFAAVAQSGPANRVYATPNGGSGQLGIRALVGADLPLPALATLGGVFAKGAVASQWLKSLGTDGAFTTTQPAFSDISGVATAGQLPPMPAYTIKGNNTNASATSADLTVSQFKAMVVQPLAVTDPAYGAKCDAVLVSDAVTTSGSATLTSASAAFTSTAVDGGKVVRVVHTNTATVTIASPGVVTWGAGVNHGLSDGDTVTFDRNGDTLPTPLLRGYAYFVVNSAATTLQLSLTSGGSAINTSGSDSGTHILRASRTFITTISAVTNSTTATLGATAPGTFSNSVMVYGTDDSAAFQAAATAAQTARSRSVYVPGSCLTTSAAATTGTPISWVGDGPSQSIIYPGMAVTGPNAGAISVTSGGSGTARGLGIYYTSHGTQANSTIAILITQSGGVGLGALNTSSIVRDVDIVNGAIGIAISNAYKPVVDNYKCSYCTNVALYLDSQTLPDAGSAVVSNSIMFGPANMLGNNCVAWVSGGGLKFNHTHCAEYEIVVNMTLSSGSLTAQAWVDGIGCDNGIDAGMTCLKFTRLGSGSSFGRLLVSNIICNGVLKCISIPTDAFAGVAITDVVMNNIIVLGQGSGSPIMFDIDSVTNLHIAGPLALHSQIGTTVGFNIGSSVVGCTVGHAQKTGTFAADSFAVSCGGQHRGTSTNDDAIAGNIGEYVSSTVLLASAVTLTTNTAADVTSISLTPGDWDVWGSVFFAPNAATTITFESGWVSLTSATFPTPPNDGAMAAVQDNFGAGTGGYGMPVGMLRVKIAATTTVYLGAYSTFAVNAQKAYGFIGARRRR